MNIYQKRKELHDEIVEDIKGDFRIAFDGLNYRLEEHICYKVFWWERSKWVRLKVRINLCDELRYDHSCFSDVEDVKRRVISGRAQDLAEAQMKRGEWTEVTESQEV